MNGFMPAATARIAEKRYENGDLVRYEVVSPESWTNIRKIHGFTDSETVKEITRLFQVNILPGKTAIGPVVIFFVPQEFDDPFPSETEIGTILDKSRKIKYWLTTLYAEGRLHLENGKLNFCDAQYGAFWEALSSAGMTGFAQVNDGTPFFLPMAGTLGPLLSHSRNSVVFNSHFFQIEATDCSTPWDIGGDPFGLLAIKGEIILPPLFEREALFVGKEGRTWIACPKLAELSVRIGSTIFQCGKNCEFYSRPSAERTPRGAGVDLVVVGRRLVGFHDGGGTEIPEAGFVVQTGNGARFDSTEVEYLGLDGVDFAVQVGPALVRGGTPARGFGSAFWRGEGPLFPPTVYPLDWENGRAARLGLGSKGGKPILIWVEGAKKYSYRRGVDSCGASLAEFTQICVELGVDDIISLDGGGSAQICIDGGRLLRLSDRHPHSYKDAERPVPLGLAFDLGLSGTCR